jgi:hypothetical protein
MGLHHESSDIINGTPTHACRLYCASPEMQKEVVSDILAYNKFSSVQNQSTCAQFQKQTLASRSPLADLMGEKKNPTKLPCSVLQGALCWQLQHC